MHTPGPLTVKGPYGETWCIFDSTGDLVGEAFRSIEQTNMADAEANARLWASAPDLLAENERLRRRVAELEGALGPLAKLDIHVFHTQDASRPIWAIGDTELYLGDVRRARKALEGWHETSSSYSLRM